MIKVRDCCLSIGTENPDDVCVDALKYHLRRSQVLEHVDQEDMRSRKFLDHSSFVAVIKECEKVMVGNHLKFIYQEVSLVPGSQFVSEKGEIPVPWESGLS